MPNDLITQNGYMESLVASQETFFGGSQSTIENTVSEQRIREDPRISVNKLGEYMSATSPRRRRRIVKDQKRPKDFVVPRYSAATDAITEYLVQSQDDQALFAAAEDLVNATTQSDWHSQTNQLAADAIELFLDVVDQLPLEEAEISRGPARPNKLAFGGVAVSVRPELLIKGKNRKGAETVGAIKLVFAKTWEMDSEAGAYVATLLHQWLEQHLEAPLVDRDLCLVVDVFSGNVYSAPRAHKRRLEDVEAACEEISRAWHAL